jgi:YD repeat-containing protein
VLTYRTDASGKKVPVTTEYDRNGRLLRQTTVDNKGQTVPLRK